MYIAHTDCRRMLGPGAKSGDPKGLKKNQKQTSEMLVGVALSLTPFTPDSHLLQRVAHFDPLSLHGRFSRSSGCIGVAAQITHLI